MNDYQFGNFVYRLREQKNMTQAELARMLGVTPAAVSKWENGSSKPRTEVLFRLAEILGVRPEELMAGHLIENPTLDPEVVKQINERYEHLQKVEVCNRSDAKLKRILAWLVDWFAIGMTAGFLVSGLDLIRQGSSPDHSGPILFLMLLAMLSFPACFIFRELIFGGRSLGKRITKLEILDQATGKPASKKQRIIRSLFFFLSYIDGIAVLVSGLSVGDRVAHTVVVPLSALVPGEKHTPEQINRYASPKSSGKKWVLIISVILVAAVILCGAFVSFISNAMESIKKSEEYQYAFALLAESEALRQLGASPEEIVFKGFTRDNETRDGHTRDTLEYRFSVRGQTYRVTFHNENKSWVLCEECTNFS